MSWCEQRPSRTLTGWGRLYFLPVLTCVVLHHPDFELDDRVGIVAAVLSLAVQMAGVCAQIQPTQEAERANLAGAEALRLKRQAPDGHGKGGGKHQRLAARERKKKEDRDAGLTCWHQRGGELLNRWFDHPCNAY